MRLGNERDGVILNKKFPLPEDPKLQSVDPRSTA